MMGRARNARWLAASLTALSLTLATSWATAASAPDPSITEKAPKLTGVLLYHHYTSYRNWDSQLMMLNLATGRIANISKNWKVIHAMNGHFSPDGTSIVFMGSKAGIKDWDIFITHFDGSRWVEPTNLTGPNGKRDEDPKFAPDGKSIAYKTDGALKVMDTSGGVLAQYTNGSPEASMPYFLPDDSGILYESNNSIMLHSNSGERLIWGGAGKSAYYPIALTARDFLFTETQKSHADRIMYGNVDGSAVPLFFDSVVWDSSDPYPYQDGSNYIFYVSTDRVTGFGGYDLVLADLKKKKVWNLWTLNHKINTALEELGPSWSALAQYPRAV